MLWNTRVLGRTIKSIAEALRIEKISKLSEFFGSDLWEGDLSAMREDRNYL